MRMNKLLMWRLHQLITNPEVNTAALSYTHHYPLHSVVKLFTAVLICTNAGRNLEIELAIKAILNFD
jgi:hypothetical protein